MTGGGGQTRGVSVEVGEEEAAVDLAMAVEYGKPIPRLTEAVSRNIISRVENLTGLRVTEVNTTLNDVLCSPRSVRSWSASGCRWSLAARARRCRRQGEGPRDRIVQDLHGHMAELLGGRS